MGGKGGESGGSQQQQMEQPSGTLGAETARLQAIQASQRQQASEEQAKKPAEPVTEDPLKQKPTDQQQQPPVPTQSLGGLGDALVSGLSPGRSKTTADPTLYDPMTGIYAPQQPMIGGMGNNSGQL